MLPALVDQGSGLLLGVREEDRIAFLTFAEEAGGGEQQLREELGTQRGIADHRAADGQDLEDRGSFSAGGGGQIAEVLEVDHVEEVADVLRVLQMRFVDALGFLHRDRPLQPQVDDIRQLQTGDLLTTLMTLEHYGSRHGDAPPRDMGPSIGTFRVLATHCDRLRK